MNNVIAFENATRCQPASPTHRYQAVSPIHRHFDRSTRALCACAVEKPAVHTASAKHEHESTQYPTEGNLARTVHQIHAVADPDITEQTTEQNRSLFRVVITPQTAFYRKYTEGLLRRYGVARLHKGRVPSLLGRELFRGRVSSYRMHSFEDVIIFVADVERCLALLTPDQQRLVVRVAVEEYTLEEASRILQWSLRTTKRRYYESIDELTAILQARNLLERDPGLAQDCGNSCQEGETSGVVITFPG